MSTYRCGICDMVEEGSENMYRHLKESQKVHPRQWDEYISLEYDWVLPQPGGGEFIFSSTFSLPIQFAIVQRKPCISYVN